MRRVRHVKMGKEYFMQRKQLGQKSKMGMSLDSLRNR